MTWRWKGAKPSPEPMLIKICVLIGHKTTTSTYFDVCNVIMVYRVMIQWDSNWFHVDYDIVDLSEESLNDTCCRNVYTVLGFNICCVVRFCEMTENSSVILKWRQFNTLRPRQNGGHFQDDSFKLIFLNENVGILINISLKFVPKGPINNILALVQIMARRRVGDKPLSEPMVLTLLTHICVTRPQWVKKKINQKLFTAIETMKETCSTLTCRILSSDLWNCIQNLYCLKKY